MDKDIYTRNSFTVDAQVTKKQTPLHTSSHISTTSLCTNARSRVKWELALENETRAYCLAVDKRIQHKKQHSDVNARIRRQKLQQLQLSEGLAFKNEYSPSVSFLSLSLSMCLCIPLPSLPPSLPPSLFQSLTLYLFFRNFPLASCIPPPLPIFTSSLILGPQHTAGHSSPSSSPSTCQLPASSPISLFLSLLSLLSLLSFLSLSSSFLNQDPVSGRTFQAALADEVPAEELLEIFESDQPSRLPLENPLRKILVRE